MSKIGVRVWFDHVKRGEKKGEEIVWHTVSYYSYDPIIDNGGLLEVEGGWDIFGHSDENYVLEQDTRLKDMFGNKIYDGDIIHNLVYDCNSAVEQAPSGAWVAKDDKGEVYEIISDLDCIKVIGNIHKNGDLLNVD